MVFVLITRCFCETRNLDLAYLFRCRHGLIYPRASGLHHQVCLFYEAFFGGLPERDACWGPPGFTVAATMDGKRADQADTLYVGGAGMPFRSQPLAGHALVEANRGCVEPFLSTLSAAFLLHFYCRYNAGTKMLRGNT